MKHLTIYLSLLPFVLASCGGKTALAPKQIKVEKVLEYFLDHYHVNPTQFKGKLQLAKKKDGYHIQRVIYDNQSKKSEVKSDELFWSLKAKAFLHISYPKGQDEAMERNKSRTFLQYTAISNGEYDVHPYYAYEGWYNDVIDNLSPHSTLSDNLLYSLARAYASLSINQLSGGQYGHNVEEESYTLKNAYGQNSMTDEQVKRYAAASKKASDTYYRLYQQNPEFETIVGSVYNTYCNEIVALYYNLRYYQNEETAAKYLIKGLYDPFMIEMAKNYLVGLAPNAILFTNGDNDTFPLSYVQAALGFRSDVTLINLSLANLPRYINHLRKPLLEARPVALSIATKDYAQAGKLDYAMLQSKRNQQSIYLDLKTVLPYLASAKGMQKMEDGSSINSIPSKYFKLKVPRAQLDPEMVADPLYKHQFVSDLSWETKKRWLLKSDIVLLDIIAANDWNRPLYFVSTTQTSDFLGLEKYLQREGLVYRLVPVRSRFAGSSSVGRIDPEIMYKNLTQTLNYAAISSLKQAGKTKQRMIVTYRTQFTALARHYLQIGDKERAEQVLDFAMEKIPVNKVPFDQATLYMVKSYTGIGSTEKALNLAQQHKAFYSTEIEQFLARHPGELSMEDFRNMGIYFVSLDVLGKMLFPIDKSFEAELVTLASQVKSLQPRFNKWVEEFAGENPGKMKAILRDFPKSLEQTLTADRHRDIQLSKSPLTKSGTSVLAATP